VLALVEILPRLLLWPISGLVADSMDRRREAQIFQTLAALEAGVLAVLQAFGLVNEWILAVATALLGLNSTFWQPVRMTLIPKLAPPEDLPNIIALTSVLANVARVVGPIVAGPAIIWGGISTAFALNGLSFVAVVAALRMMDLKAAATATALFAMTTNSIIALILIFIVGLGVTGNNIVAQTMVQSGLDDEVRGRVFSFYSVIFGAAPSGGALLLGYIGDLVGIRGPIVAAAMVGLGASLMIFIHRKSLAPHLEVMVVDNRPAEIV
jgi:MFS family permease